MLSACAAPTPEIIEREVVVEKPVVQTVVVEKERVVEKPVVQTVVVEKEVPVEKVVKETVVVEKEVQVEVTKAPTVVTYPRSETLYISGAAWGPPSDWNPFITWSKANTSATVGLIYETLFMFSPLTG